MLGLELVRERTTKEPLARDVTRALYQECPRRGLVVMCCSPAARINPPLVITEDRSLQGLEIPDEALGAVLFRHSVA